MIVDTSAIIAVLLREPSRDALMDALQLTEPASTSVATVLEISIVLQRKRTGISDEVVDRFLSSLHVEIVPVAMDHVRIARAAYREFGRGSGHPAQLNFGDCFSYALARSRNEPLLFTGNDFLHTDLVPVLPA